MEGCPDRAVLPHQRNPLVCDPEARHVAPMSPALGRCIRLRFPAGRVPTLRVWRGSQGAAATRVGAGRYFGVEERGEMVATQQQAVGSVRFHDSDVILPVSDTRPACADPMYDPAWWDTDTHTHHVRYRCEFCTQARAICGDCPIQQRCAALGERTKTPVLIYAGAVYSHMGRVPGCRNCGNPLPAKSGRIAVIPTCCSDCNLGLREKSRSGTGVRATSEDSAPRLAA
jgi:hypothetical protein